MNSIIKHRLDDDEDIQNDLLCEKRRRLKARNDFKTSALALNKNWHQLFQFGDDQDFIDLLSFSRSGFELISKEFNYFLTSSL